MYENTETRTLPTSASSDSIFSRELDDTNTDHKFEDKIVRHLTGDVESIAIPATATTRNSVRDINYASSSIESSNSLKSTSKWFCDTEERPWSPDPFVPVSSSPSSLSLESSSAFVSPSEYYHVAMPK